MYAQRRSPRYAPCTHNDSPNAAKPANANANTPYPCLANAMCPCLAPCPIAFRRPPFSKQLLETSVAHSNERVVDRFLMKTKTVRPPSGLVPQKQTKIGEMGRTPPCRRVHNCRGGFPQAAKNFCKTGCKGPTPQRIIHTCVQCRAEG